MGILLRGLSELSWVPWLGLAWGAVSALNASTAYAVTEEQFEREHVELFSLDSPGSLFLMEPAPSELADPLGNDFTTFAMRDFPELGLTVPETGPAAAEFYKSMAFMTKRARGHVQDVLDRAFSNYGSSGRTRVQIAKAAFAEMGLPEALVWMAAQESGFSERAKSRKGALGVWQFMPATARRFNLTNRKDLKASSLAATRFLSEMYNGELHPVTYRWKGWRGRKPLVWKKDWALAMSGYNAGEYNVTRAIYRHLLALGEKRENPEQPTFWDIRNRLPGETRHYVPVILAWIRVAEDPKRFGFKN